jgi:hypothetical protein
MMPLSGGLGLIRRGVRHLSKTENGNAYARLEFILLKMKMTTNYR